MKARPLRKKKPVQQIAPVVAEFRRPERYELVLTDGVNEVTISDQVMATAPNPKEVKDLALRQLAGMRGRGALCRDCAFDDCNSDNCMCQCHLSHEAAAAIFPSNLPWSDPNSDPMGDMRRWSSKRPTNTRTAPCRCSWCTVGADDVTPAPFLSPALKEAWEKVNSAIIDELRKLYGQG